jgi:hypothetical protein
LEHFCSWGFDDACQNEVATFTVSAVLLVVMVALSWFIGGYRLAAKVPVAKDQRLRWVAIS